MAVSYNGLWKLLIDKNMQKKYLMKALWTYVQCIDIDPVIKKKTE